MVIRRRDGEEAYEEDVRRLRAYTDMKNASLYSFNVGVRFGKPNDEIPCNFYDTLRALAEGRLNAFRAMYVEPIRRSGGLEAFLEGPWAARADEILQRLVGDEGRAAFEEYQVSGDEPPIQSLFDRLLHGSGSGE